MMEDVERSSVASRNFQWLDTAATSRTVNGHLGNQPMLDHCACWKDTWIILRDRDWKVEVQVLLHFVLSRGLMFEPFGGRWAMEEGG
jgi:hypothetical protein